MSYHRTSDTDTSHIILVTEVHETEVKGGTSHTPLRHKTPYNSYNEGMSHTIPITLSPSLEELGPLPRTRRRSKSRVRNTSLDGFPSPKTQVFSTSCLSSFLFFVDGSLPLSISSSSPFSFSDLYSFSYRRNWFDRRCQLPQ